MIHPLADVKSQNIGSGTSIWQFCIILEKAQIGSNCNINCNVFIENDVVVGNNVTIKPGVQLWDGLTIEDSVFIGPNVTFTNDHVPRSKQYPALFARTKVCEGASIGANATILTGLTIGSYSLIGAGTVLTKSVPPFTVWYGNPGSQKGYITRRGIILNSDLVDENGKKYIIRNSEPVLL
jgi:UDP-2-acetamido-3-amino-2,3-dideoxy-glucuronate N-acetyltransferase